MIITANWLVTHGWVTCDSEGVPKSIGAGATHLRYDLVNSRFLTICASSVTKGFEAYQVDIHGQGVSVELVRVRHENQLRMVCQSLYNPMRIVHGVEVPA